MSGFPCGNNPHYVMSPGDAAAVANFRAFLTARTEEKTTVSELDDARAALTLFLTTKYHIRIDRFEAAVRANERASSEARRLGAPDAAPAPSAAIRRKLRRWAYAAGHIESELADAVDRMYAAIAGDIAGQQFATGRADLRQRIATALYAHDHPGWLLPLHESDVEPVYQGRAAAVLPVLPAPADQVTGLLRRAEAYLSALHGSVARHDSLAANLACAGCELRDQIRAELRRAADEEPAQAVGFELRGTAETRDEVLREIGDRLARRATLYGDSRTVNRVIDDLIRLADDKPQPAMTMHAVPLQGSNGISACCGRPPCEFVGERVTHDPDAVTCTGPAAAAGEPEDDEGGYAQPDLPIRCALPEQPEATP